MGSRDWPHWKARVVKVFIYLSDVAAHGGCTALVPGSRAHPELCRSSVERVSRSIGWLVAAQTGGRMSPTATATALRSAPDLTVRHPTLSLSLCPAALL